MSDEIFNADRSVITWKGEDYYKACGKYVARLDLDETSHCVKREGHPSMIHEDFVGRTRDEGYFGFQELSIQAAVAQAIGMASNCWENMSGAGVFDDKRAAAIVDQLLLRIHSAVNPDLVTYRHIGEGDNNG